MLSRSRDISTLHVGDEKKSESTNPKIKSLLDEIINDSSTDNTTQQTIPALRKSLTPPVLPAQKKILPSPEVIAAIFPSSVKSLKRKVRTKEDIMGYSDGESSEEGESSDEAEEPDDSSTGSEESIDITDIKPPKVKFLPATVEGLRKRFKKLYNELMRGDKKHEHRNELVFILDELLRQKAISQGTYTQVNNLLAESLSDNGSEAEEMDVDDDTAINEESEEDVLKNLIQPTTDEVIHHDKKQLVELLKEIKEEAGEEY